MNTVVIKRGIGQIAANMTVSKPLAGLAICGLLALEQTREPVWRALSDAYFQVSVFVAATLFGAILFEKVRRRRIHDILRAHPRGQIAIAATLGAIPGCGGAIVVMTQYIRGAVSFGGVVAVLTATMGDAAFLLLAKSPLDALTIFALCYAAGIVFGYAVDKFHGRDFMRMRVSDYEEAEEDVEENPLLEPFYKLWMLLFVPGAICALAIAMQFDIAAQWGIGGVDWVTPFGAAAALLALGMWLLNPLSDIRMSISQCRPLSRRVADMTNFITFWVLCGYVGYELLVLSGDWELKTLFDTWKYAVPLMAVLIGFVPGCGPQIVVTTMYLNGLIPFSAQLANAISNDGDALFPALRLAPRASALATAYTAVPAIILGYGWLFLFE